MNAIFETFNSVLPSLCLCAGDLDSASALYRQVESMIQSHASQQSAALSATEAHTHRPRLRVPPSPPLHHRKIIQSMLTSSTSLQQWLQVIRQSQQQLATIRHGVTQVKTQK